MSKNNLFPKYHDFGRFADVEADLFWIVNNTKGLKQGIMFYILQKTKI